MYGYQFTLELEGLEYVSISSEQADMTEANIALLEEDVITVSYASNTPLMSGDNMFTLTVEAKQSGNVQQMVEITGTELNNEGYVGTDLEIYNMILDVDGSYNLYQNKPNPFDQATSIGFSVPVDERVVLTIYDVTGKVMLTRTGNYPKGYHEIQLQRADLNGSGVMYYTIQSGNYRATRKMILID
jgi:hypothetical protein